MTDSLHDQPKFLIWGGEHEGKVVLYASTKIKELKLHIQNKWTNRLNPELLSSTTTITAEIGDFVAVMAETWPEAFKLLFEQWSPHQPQQSELGSAKELES